MYSTPLAVINSESPLKNNICEAVSKFDLCLSGKTVLTEAASGNYVATPLLAALAGAKVFAFAKDSRHGTASEVSRKLQSWSEALHLTRHLTIVDSLDSLRRDQIDVVTNTGHLRPLHRAFLSSLPPSCVIPLMYEPWEYRQDDLDLPACGEFGIKVYGTNESDPRVRTLAYLGMSVQRILTRQVPSRQTGMILLVGCARFVNPVHQYLTKQKIDSVAISDLSLIRTLDIDLFRTIVILEHERDDLIMGGPSALMDVSKMTDDTIVIHVCGNVSFQGAGFRFFPPEIRPFGYMSVTADYADSRALVDLHAAGLKVAEVMLSANTLGFSPVQYKEYVERHSPSLAFEDPNFW